MKKLLLLTFLTVGMTANAETIVTNDDDNVIENKGGISLGQGKDEDDRWSMHFNVGVNIPTSTNGLDFAPFRSWEFGWTIAQYDWTPKNSKTTLSAGLGIEFRNYTLSGNDNMFVKVAENTSNNEVISVHKRPGEFSELSSSIYTFGFQMPLLVKQRFSKDFAISLGAQLNWYSYARVNNHYEMGDDEYEVSTKKIGHRPFTVDVLGIVHLGNLGIYCKYSPMSVLKKDKGPEFKSVAVGVYF